MSDQPPLASQNVLLTRPTHQCDELRRIFEGQGATNYLQPTIEILPPENWQEVDKAIDSVFRYDILVFASSNGVSSFFDRARVVSPALFPGTALSCPKMVATGPGTSETLTKYGVKEIASPSKSYDAEGIVTMLASQNLAGKRVLLVRGNRGRRVLPDELTRLGALVEEVTVYRSIDLAAPFPEIASLMQCGKIHWVTVTSSAIGRSLVTLFGQSLRQTKIASLSPITSQTMTECGFPPAVEAVEATVPALVEAVVKAAQGKI